MARRHPAPPGVTSVEERLRLTRLRLLDSDRAVEAMRVSNSWWLTQPLRGAERRWPATTQAVMRAVKLFGWTLRGQLPARLRGQRTVRAVPTAATASVPNANMLAPPPAPRQRSILIVDDKVPQPDRDAGSRATLGVIETLRNAGWSVTFWPHDRRHAGPYTVALEAAGIAVIDAREADSFDGWLVRHAERFGHVMLMRSRPATAVLAHVLRHAHAFVSYYGHDIHGLRLQREAELAGDAFLADAAGRELAAERRIWRAVDAVLYLSEAETAFVRATEPGVAACTLPGFTFESFPTPPALPPGAEMLFVGGFGHAPNRDAALWCARVVLPLVLVGNPAARLVLAGAEPTREIEALAGAGVEVTGWLTGAALSARYAAARVVVAPLRFGAGVKGKVVEALHLGRPLVATTVAAEGLPGLEGIVPVVDDAAAFAAGVAGLLGDDATWRVQAAAQIEYARAHCSRAALRTALWQALQVDG